MGLGFYNWDYLILNFMGMLVLIGFSACTARRFIFNWFSTLLYIAGIFIIFLFGSRLFYTVFYQLSIPTIHLFDLKLYGFSLYGGLFLLIFYFTAIAGFNHIPIWTWLDYHSLGLLVYIISGKIGCYLNGCCFGTPTILPWGIPYTEGSQAYQYYIVDALQNLDFQKWQVYSDLIHPVQLYESILAFLLLIIAVILLKRKVTPGIVFLLAAGLYSLGRLGLFYLRAAPDGAPLYHFFPWLYLVVAVISLGILLIKLMKANELSI